MNTIRDMKKHTSKQLICLVKTVPESRREFLLNKFCYEAKRTKRGKDYLFWQEVCHAKQIITSGFLCIFQLKSIPGLQFKSMEINLL